MDVLTRTTRLAHRGGRPVTGRGIRPLRGRATCAFRRRGFTIIELLVVVSILMLLIALLLPALARVRYEGKSALCTSRKRQVAAGLTTYANDFDGWYPMRWPDGSTYNHPFWWGRPNNARDMSDVAEQYFNSGVRGTPKVLLCAVAPRAIWGVDIPWPLSNIYRTNVAVTAGWDWATTNSSAAVPQLELSRMPLRVDQDANAPLAFDLIEYMTGDSVGGFTGWVIGHSADERYHVRGQNPEDLPPNPIPFAYSDGSVRATTNLEPFYRDPGWGMKFWAAGGP